MPDETLLEFKDVAICLVADATDVEDIGGIKESLTSFEEDGTTFLDGEV